MQRNIEKRIQFLLNHHQRIENAIIATLILTAVTFIVWKLYRPTNLMITGFIVVILLFVALCTHALVVQRMKTLLDKYFGHWATDAQSAYVLYRQIVNSQIVSDRFIKTVIEPLVRRHYQAGYINHSFQIRSRIRESKLITLTTKTAAVATA